jgi:hypothetical protein
MGQARNPFLSDISDDDMAEALEELRKQNEGLLRLAMALAADPPAPEKERAPKGGPEG